MKNYKSKILEADEDVFNKWKSLENKVVLGSKYSNFYGFVVKIVKVEKGSGIGKAKVYLKYVGEPTKRTYSVELWIPQYDDNYFLTPKEKIPNYIIKKLEPWQKEAYDDYLSGKFK
jgi:hypothetical protein